MPTKNARSNIAIKSRTHRTFKFVCAYLDRSQFDVATEVIDRFNAEQFAALKIDRTNLDDQRDEIKASNDVGQNDCSEGQRASERSEIDAEES